MPDNSIESARERLAEQIMSDERLLGALPETATQLVLDYALARLDAAATRAASVDELETEATAIRSEASAVVEQAASADDAEAAVRALLPAEPAAEQTASATIDETASPEVKQTPEAGDIVAPAEPSATAAAPETEPPIEEPQPDGATPSPETPMEPAPPQPEEPPSLWERVRSMWRGFGRDD